MTDRGPEHIGPRPLAGLREGWCVAEGYACPVHAEEATATQEDTDA